ncbi:MAG: GNAT family N-acetyltransferase [Actinomycetota bacterium]
MLIRDVHESDLPRLLEINVANVPEVGPVDADRLAAIVDWSAMALVVEAAVDEAAVDEIAAAEIAGFCLVLGPDAPYDSVNYRWFMERHDDAMYLDRVAFDARFQGRGLGRALYGEVFERMRRDHPALGVLTLEVNADPPNEPSLRFHDRLGFTEIGRLASKNIECSMMSLRLTP